TEITNFWRGQFVVVVALSTLALVDLTLAGHAHSFAHFHGPVEGPGHEITVHDKHGHHTYDYVAHPKYEFSYGVEDHHTGDYHGQKEQRDGKHVTGEYTIKEPGGNVRTVKYHADPHGGFFAHVHNSGGNDHSGGTYGGHGHEYNAHDNY
ncbi:PREDICTED: cuticle protein-like, partial [Ceratosolen solmsi marchali]|uniref:Cuticle protein-like n=1 Tax=Ceratosolen solmsi marchali TaxID=326594 RepID=A0AAJ6VKR5_9HYME